jgi:hypothetical protein
MMHDVHHVVTGYGTDLVGEAEVSAWELRRGLRGLGVYVGSIIVAGAFAGLLAAPWRTLRAWRASGMPGASSKSRTASDGPGATRPRSSLFQSTRPYDELLSMTVGELRRELGVGDAGIAARPRQLHAYAPRDARSGHGAKSVPTAGSTMA